MLTALWKNRSVAAIFATVILFSFTGNINAQKKQSECKVKCKTECTKKCGNKKECSKKGSCKTKCSKKSFGKSECSHKRSGKSKCTASCKVSNSKAVSVIYPTEGNKVHGTVTFTKVENGIKVVADIEGLTPGKHGFHIHEFGDCSDPKGKSAGGHFNPDKVAHAGHNSKTRHVGDFGNITADKSGKAHVEFIDNLISFCGPHNIIGRGIVIHGGADDLTSQPSGAAGPRVACGSISLSK